MNRMKTMADDQLVKLYLSNVNEAFDELLLRYKDKLYTYIKCNVKSADLADDLFQETFVKAIIHIRNGRYIESGKFYGWLTRIAHNLIIDQYRTERNENTISNDELSYDLFDNAVLCQTSRESEIISEQTLSQIRSLVKYLPESQRTVIEMRFYQDLSFKEISEKTGVSINTALGRMRYAIINMKKFAAEHGICTI